MTITITPEIEKKYQAYLDEQVDADYCGNPILRRHTMPYFTNKVFGLVDFAAGFQAATPTVVREFIASESWPHLLAALRNQRQVDEDGTDCGVSRQAVDKALEPLEAQQQGNKTEGTSP